MEKKIQDLLDKLSDRRCSQNELDYLLRIFGGKEESELSRMIEKDWTLCYEDSLHNEEDNRKYKEEIWRGIRLKIRQDKSRLFLRKTLKYAAIFVVMLIVSLFVINTFKGDISKEILLVADGKVIIVNDKNTARLAKMGIEYREGILTYQKTLIQKEHIIRVPSVRKQRLFMPDGTEIWLNSKSELTLRKTDWSDQKDSELDRVVFLKGEAYFSVVTTGRKFLVISDKINVKVLGTKFVFTAFDEINRVVLEQGSVRVSLAGHDSRYANLQPGEMAVLKDTNEGFNIEKIVPENFSLWKEGIIMFNDEKFDNILKILEREYNIVIINNNVELSNKTFTGRFYKGEIEQILDVFNFTNGITYKKTKNSIIIN